MLNFIDMNGMIEALVRKLKYVKTEEHNLILMRKCDKMDITNTADMEIS